MRATRCSQGKVNILPLVLFVVLTFVGVILFFAAQMFQPFQQDTSNNSLNLERMDFPKVDHKRNGSAMSTTRTVDKVSIDGDSAYYKGKKLMGVDTETFASINNCSDLGGSFALLDCPSSYYDANNLYFVNNTEGPITIVDRNSFRHITDSYFADQNDVYIKIAYIETNELIPLGADPKTFQVLSSGFSRDKNNLFFATQATLSNGTSAAIENGDPSSFVDLPSFFAKDKTYVYVVTQPYEGLSSVRVLSSADPVTFTVLDDAVGLAKDNNSVFLSDKILEQVRSASFRVLPPLNEKGNLLNGVYAIDDSNAYFFEEYEISSSPKRKTIPDADSDTFTNLDGIYAKDSRTVYIRGKKIESVDPDTFSSLGYGFAHGGNDVYGSSFNTYDFGYEFPVSCVTCNLDSLVMLNGEYARDSSNVYYYDSLNRQFTSVERADITTFRVSNAQNIHTDVDAQDKNYSYRNGQIVFTI